MSKDLENCKAIFGTIQSTYYALKSAVVHEDAKLIAKAKKRAV
jgi:hypothetical protein